MPQLHLRHADVHVRHRHPLTSGRSRSRLDCNDGNIHAYHERANDGCVPESPTCGVLTVASLLQSGNITVQLTSGVGSGTVTFPEPYPSIPPYVVMAPVIGGSLGNKLNFSVKNITKEGFDVVCERDTGYISIIFHWIAVPR